MRPHNALIYSAIALTILPTVAGAWEHRHERGIDLYRIENAGMVVSLVCDPNQVYGTTESAVLIEANNNPDLSVEVDFSFPEGSTIKARLVHGRFGKAMASQTKWEALITGFRTHQAVTVTIDENAVKVELGTPMLFTCL